MAAGWTVFLPATTVTAQTGSILPVPVGNSGAPSPAPSATVAADSISRPAAVAVAATPGKFDCAPVLLQMRTDFAVDPGRLILAVEDALTTNEICVCPIIRTAVDLAGRDPAVTSKIVTSAVRQAPRSAASIIECALTEAPGAAAAIRAAVSAELGDSAAEWLDNGESAPDSTAGSAESSVESSGKQTVSTGPGLAKGVVGKMPLPPEPEIVDEGWPQVGVSGIYVTSPGRSPADRVEKRKIPVVRKFIFRKKKIIYRPCSPATRDFPE